MSESTKLPVPCVHLNGTGGRGLREQAKEAYSALGDATKAMQQALPHGRDYYPFDKGTPNGPSYKAARDAHLALRIGLGEGRINQGGEEAAGQHCTEEDAIHGG